LPSYLEIWQGQSQDWLAMKEIIAAVRQAIPNASSKPPGAVFEHVLGALRQAEAEAKSIGFVHGGGGQFFLSKRPA
jgi:hypothetical protein